MTLCDICDGRSGSGAGFSPRFVLFTMLIIIPPLLHIHHHCHMKCALVLTKQHIIISVVCKFRISSLTRHLADHWLSEEFNVFTLIADRIPFNVKEAYLIRLIESHPENHTYFS